ncbi:MAG: nucleotide-binding universal stress UspA family protein [Acidimicrobiales bacterium]
MGVDGSPGSIAALRWAAERAEQFGPVRPVMAWHVPWWLTASPMPGAPLPPSPDFFEASNRQQLEETLEVAKVPNYAEPVVVNAAAGPSLVTNGSDAALIVVGTRGRGPAKDTLLGSVSCHVAAHATVPVAIVPETLSASDEPRRVVVGIDGSPTSIAALCWAIKNTPDETTLEAMHVWHFVLSTLPERGPIDPSLFERQAASILDESIVRATVAAGEARHEIVPKLENGDPRNILRAASETADLLVLGAQGHRGIAHLALGSITTGLIHQPKTTTIVIPSTQTT